MSLPPGMGVVRYVVSHALPIMAACPPDQWWQACRALPEGEIRREVTAWLRIQKQRLDCWARAHGPQETKKPRRR